MVFIDYFGHQHGESLLVQYLLLGGHYYPVGPMSGQIGARPDCINFIIISLQLISIWYIILFYYYYITFSL